MEYVFGAILVVLLALAVFTARTLVHLADDARRKLLLIEVALGDIAGRQFKLADDYRDVHAILKQIRDLNVEELQDRKEILQRQNLTAANRVLQTRKHMQELEEAARRELEGLKNG